MRAALILLCLAGSLSAERVRFEGADGKKISMEFHRGTDSAAVIVLAEKKKAKALQQPVAEWKRLGVAVAVLEPRSHLDVGAAIDYLEAEKGCDRSRLAVVGQGRAGALAFQAAARAPEDFRVVVLTKTAATYPGLSLDAAAARWRGTRTLALSCDAAWERRLDKFPAFTTKGAPIDFVKGALLDLRVPHWQEELGAKSSPENELRLAVAGHLGDAVARRRVDGFEYALVANRRSGGKWNLKARILPARVNPKVLRTVITFHGEIHFHIGKETFRFVVDTDDPDPKNVVALLARRKSRALKGKGPHGDVEGNLGAWGARPEGLALTFKRALTSPAEIGVEFLPRGTKPIRLPQSEELFRATVQTLDR